MDQNTELQRFLITYIETDEFNKIIKEQTPIAPQTLQYVKFIAPSLDEVGTMLDSRFSDVHVIGVAAESDFLLSMEKLKNSQPDDTVYVIVRTDINGNTMTDIVMSPEGISKEEILSTLTVEEFKQAFTVPLSYLQSDETPTVRYDER